MVEQAIERTTILASVRRCFEVATDFEKYPLWAQDIKRTKVLSRDDQGRAVDVEYVVEAMGRSTTYTLRYSYDTDPLRLRWRLKSGDVVTRLDGEYEFRPASDKDQGHPIAGAVGEVTEVVYRLVVDLAVSLPGFLKRRVEARIVHTALYELKHYVEASCAVT